MKFLCAVLVFSCSFLFAQDPFPQGYFIMPINPGQISSLSGCFGDIRINHFHAGLDVRTGGAEGLNVYAAASGYISRIKIANGGYGNALYITHPNGYTTLYAHLKTLNDTLQKYLVKKQYEQKTWEIDFSLKPSEFTVNQGDIIALSGNTGGSAGAHLHFEIRDKYENICDPSQFGFSELVDNIAPIIEFVSLKCMSTDARINGQFGIFNFPVVRGKNGLYTIPNKLTAKGLIGLEILTYDKSSRSPFRQGINQINLNVNQKLAYNFRLDKMSFDNKLDMNLHVNYEKLIIRGQKIHKCYVESGNTLNAYKTNELKGLFTIENHENTVDIRVNDSFANTSTLKFLINYDSVGIKKNIIPQPGIVEIKSALFNDFLKIDINDPKNEFKNIKLVKGNSESLMPLTELNVLQKSIILDLKNGIPDEVFLNNTKLTLPFTHYITLQNPKINNTNLKADFTSAIFGPNILNVSVSEEELNLHQDILPLKSFTTITWTKLNEPAYPEKLKVYLIDKKRKYIGGTWQKNNVIFNIKEYGKYQTIYDFDPPVITPKIIASELIKFKVSDSLSGIKEIMCKINDEWVLMNYEYKSGIIWAERIDKSKPFSGKVVLKIIDNCDNINTFETEISIL